MHDSDQTDAGSFRKGVLQQGMFEPKIDRARCIAYIFNNTVELKNRRMRSITYRCPEIIRALKQVERSRLRAATGMRYALLIPIREELARDISKISIGKDRLMITLISR